MPLHFNLLDSSSSEEENETNILPAGTNYRQVQLRRQIYRSRINFEICSAKVFIERFRISASAAEKVLNAIGPLIIHRTNINHALNPKQQILVALHFFGTGNQYHAVADMHGIHKSTVCRIVDRVSKAILRILFPVYVRWPPDSTYIPGEFSKIAHFPRVAGAVDGTLIPIKAPHINEKDYVDRHGKHSINAMVVCGPQHEFFYASARWPGSVHDSLVLRNSTLFQKWEIQGNISIDVHQSENNLFRQIK